MKRLISIALAAMLSIGIMSTAFAAATVGSAMYVDDIAPGQSQSVGQITEELKNEGITDVDPTFYAAGSITVLVSEGYLAPSPDGTFKPQAPVDGTTIVAVFAKVLGLADKNDTSAQALEKAQQAGLITSSTSVPAEMTRMDVARMLAKALGITAGTNTTDSFTDTAGLSPADRSILAALYAHGIFKGLPDGTFHPGSVLIKAELAVLVDRILGGKK